MHKDEIIKVKAPGKLYLAGEYAVVSPFNPALVFAVNAFIDISVRYTKEKKIFDSSTKSVYSWSINSHNEVKISKDENNNLELTAAAMTVSLNYLRESFPELLNNTNFTIYISSDLENTDGTKYGYGSSGAATVAACRAILKLYELDKHLDPQSFNILTFKLACISQTRLNKLGSFGDLAASSIYGLVHYQNFDRKILKNSNVRELRNISAVVNKSWPGLELNRIALPQPWRLNIVWSKQAISTEKLLKNKGKAISQELEAEFLEKSKVEVLAVLNAIQTGDWPKFKFYLEQNQKSIIRYLKLQERPYIMPTFKKAKKIADKFGAAFKISGAGAGDCAIAISEDKESADKLKFAWQEAGLTVLEHKLWER